MTTYANRVLRRMHMAAIVALGISIAGILYDRPRLALAPIIPVLFVVIFSLEALRVSARNPEKR